MRLYMIHCGFYDPEIGNGIYENHTNIFISAETIEEARSKAKALPEFKRKHMHIDGLLEIQAVEGHQVVLQKDPALEGKTRISSLKYGSRVPKITEESASSSLPS